MVKGGKEERTERGAREKEGSDRMQSFNLFLFLFFCFSFSVFLVPFVVLGASLFVACVVSLSRVTQIPSTCTIWAARTVPFWTKFVFHR